MSNVRATATSPAARRRWCRPLDVMVAPADFNSELDSCPVSIHAGASQDRNALNAAMIATNTRTAALMLASASRGVSGGSMRTRTGSSQEHPHGETRRPEDIVGQPEHPSFEMPLAVVFGRKLPNNRRQLRPGVLQRHAVPKAPDDEQDVEVAQRVRVPGEWRYRGAYR